MCGHASWLNHLVCAHSYDYNIKIWVLYYNFINNINQKILFLSCSWVGNESSNSLITVHVRLSLWIGNYRLISCPSTRTPIIWPSAYKFSFVLKSLNSIQSHLTCTKRRNCFYVIEGLFGWHKDLQLCKSNFFSFTSNNEYKKRLLQDQTCNHQLKSYHTSVY